MNDPIVSPWLVYLIMQVESFRVLFAVSGLIPFAIVFGLWLSEEDEKARWLLRRAIVPCIVAVFLTIFIPGQKTIIAMIAAKHITPQTVEQGIDVVKKVKDEAKADVMDLIKALTQESTQVEKEE